MDPVGLWRKYKIIVFHFLLFNLSSSADVSSGNAGNVSSQRQFADIALGQQTLPSWYYTSIDAVPKHGTVSIQSHNRWRTQMAFSKTVYSFEVKEDTQPVCGSPSNDALSNVLTGTVVGKVETAFRSLTPITYSVQEDEGENIFLLSPLSGEFLLSRSLDFEAQRFYILTVAVQQGDSQVSSVRVYFNVLDVNDNPPVFSQRVFYAHLLEDAQVGTCFLSVNVSDKDDGDNGDLKLEVDRGNEDSVFFIDQAGRLCLNAELDRETQSSYNLTVTANDCVLPVSLQLSSTAHITVVVNDVNDNAPLFVSAKCVSLPEDTAPHSVVMTVQAEDEDAGSNGEVLYYLKNTSGGLFSIGETSGKIYLEEELDREEADTMTISVTATDRGSPRMTTAMNLTVHIEDVNDHDPEFSHSTYSFTVGEDTPRGTSVFQLQAHDRDIGTNGQIRYMLSQVGPFAVDVVRGIVTVMEQLDREKQSNYTLIVTAVDRGSVPRSTTAAVNVTVLDINDCTPLFSPQALIIHVMEDEEDPSPLTHQVSALDEDLGANSQLTYSITKENGDGLFSITPNGTFKIVHSLDREKESLFIITITAVDSGLPPLTGTLTVHIMVDDINDNHPEFTEDVYNTIVSEDSPTGTVFAMITASDIDEGVNGEIRYFMENPDVPFAIEETSGELFTTNALDRETVAVYRLTVVGSDKHPTQPLSSSVLVTVLIGDINDHWPQFLNSPYVAYVPDEITPGLVVCAVRATDGDTEMNAELRYSLYGQSSDLFVIDPYSGTVFTSSATRRMEDIVVNVHVEDAGENPKFDIATISVRFQNISEFPEMNVDVLNYTLPEDEPVGTLVAVASAVSIRAEPISFYIASGNFEDTFHLEQSSGELTVENPLDHENKKEFTLLIEARDSGSPPLSSFTEIHLNISDINDNFPQFMQADYRCEVFENSPPSWVCDVLAIDADSDSYGTLRYNITEGNADNFFTIDHENGYLSTTASLDRENISEYNLTVEAAELDNPIHKTKATVIILVLDRNDNAPRFSQIFLTQLPEDAPVGHSVIHISSNDDDTGVNAIINYSIIGKADVPFSIDFTSGDITVKRLLDREIHDHYTLKVSANDSAWSISTDVTIIITDINDNRPIFSDHFDTVVLPETKDTVVYVMQVLATDADVGQNSEILYFIEPSHEDFWVNSSTGEIYTKQLMTLYNYPFEIYQFSVFAFDCGSTPLYSNTTVTLRLVPYNNYAPVFLPVQPLIVIPYHMAVGTEVVRLTAVDLDVSNSSANVEYVITGGNASDFFWIQSDTGKITLNQTLAESVNLLVTLIIVAKDQGTPPLSSHTEITFEITGRNQFPPSFVESDVTFSVPEDLPVGSVIGKIQAEDRDYGSNGAIMYYIITENQYLPFSVGESSGLLTLIIELDFEKEGVYHLQIRAVDGGWVSKTGRLNVTVVVMDVNDNPPVFSSSEYLVSVPENSEIGTNVLNVKATDADSGINAQIFYSLIAGHVDKFAVDSRNGTITTLDIFDYEQEQIFDITIKASNTGSHTFSLAHIVIQISDINEFTPAFRKKEFNFRVFKNVPIGTRIGKVTAIDYDQGSGGQVFYLMFGQNKYMGFDVETDSGEIYTTSSLRKQGNNNIDLKVLAKNSGVITGRDVDEALVRISVIDTNDAPMFTSALYMANVTEDSPVGTSVITVSALDEDAIFDWNRVFFSIESGNTNFSFTVDSPTGVISVNSSLDRELWPVYNLTVTATDNGSPPSTGTANVIVTIGDVNDNAPKLTFTEIWVKENQPQGTTVARLNASDSDLPLNQGPLTYWLVNPSAEIPFSLTPDGGLVTTRPIDREQISSYHILVAVGDAGTPALSSTTIFHVSIVDENDNPSLPRNIFIEVKYFGSSFQGGMIGNVHPEDPDASDTFTCTIKSGPTNMFMIPNGTCVLWSSPFQGEATFNITIEATDQLHFPVNNSIYINYKGFTNASIDNCILFYVSSSSMEEFLSNKYLKFVKALDSLFNLQASKTHVFGIKHIGREILLLAAVKNYHGQYLSREVASGISAGHKKLLEAQSNVTISHITTNPCLTSPCQNGAMCNKNIYISQDVAVLESLAVIFVSPQKEVLNCTCPVGFTGTLCEDEINECEVNPCENQGTCVNTAGSFYCQCQSGFHGPVCSPDVDECLKIKCQNGGTCIPTQDGFDCQCAPGFEGKMCEQFIDHCRSAPCDRGSCINSHTGFSCYCPFGVSGVYCEEHSYGFEELSFMELPPLDRRTNLISLEFATVQSNSLLLYNPGELSSRDFFALEILDGVIHLTYDLGSGPVRLQTNKQVADGHFHSITVRRIGHMASLHVDNCADVGNNGFCFSQSDGDNSDRTLDVGNSNMTFGGLRTMEQIFLHPAQIQTHDFVGCIRNLYINGILLRHSKALATYNILDRCPRAAVSPCHTNPCKNGGVCHDLWSDHLCECKGHFTGSNCEKEISEELVFRFNDNDYIEYVIKERLRRDHLLKHLLNDGKEGNTRDQTVINIKFKTKEDGVLMFVLRQAGYFLLKVEDRKLVYISEDTLTGVVSEFTVDSPVTDGLWHLLSMFSKGQNTFLHLDGKPVLNITGQNMDLTPVTVEKIILGAAVTSDSNLQHSGFSGCVQYFSVTSYTLSVSQHSVMVDVRPSSTLVQSSCSSPRVCLPSPCSEEDSAQKDCLSAHCQNRWRCGAAVQNHSCICLHNVSNYICDICMSTAEGRDHCYEEQGSLPQWLIAVILPLISILLIIFLILFRVRQQAAKCQSDSLPEKKDQGTDNVTFCFDNIRSLTNIAPAEMDKCDPVGADEQSHVSEFYSDANLASVQLVQNSELEYCEIGSISSAFHSETHSPKLDWHKLYYSTKCGRDYSKQWENLKMLLAGFHMERSSKEMPKSPAKPQNVAFLNTQVLPAVGADQFQHTPPCYTKTFLQPELLEHVQCLTSEEIGKLNTPPEQAKPHRASLRSEGKHKSTTMIYASSDSETDSTFTCSESEYRQLSMTREHLHDQLSLSACSFTQKDNLPTNNSLFEHNFNSDAAQYKAESTSSGVFAQWERLLNMHLPFSSYAPVFEDIACLPIEPSHSYDMQSDIEEII